MKFQQPFRFGVLLLALRLSLLWWIVPTTQHTAHAAEPLKVVFVGKYRSGSSSLAAALRRLGYNACHGRDVVYQGLGSHSHLSDALASGNVSEILQATSDLGCNATLEMHAVFWKQIVELSSNDTKYIVIIRPFDAWKRSVTNLFTELLPVHRYPLRFLPKINKASNLFASLAQYEVGLDSREKALHSIRHPKSPQFQAGLKKLYDNFVHDAHELLRNQPTQTLLFDMREGYLPLCSFLGVNECPEDDFPHLNKARDIQSELFLKRVKEFFLHAAILTISLVPGFVIWRRRRSGNLSK